MTSGRLSHPPRPIPLQQPATHTHSRMHYLQEQTILARGKSLPVKHVLKRANDAKPKWWRSASANQARKHAWEKVRLQHVTNFLEEELAADIVRMAAVARVAEAKEAVEEAAERMAAGADGTARVRRRKARLDIAQAKLKAAEFKVKTLETLRVLQKDILDPEMGGGRPI